MTLVRAFVPGEGNDFRSLYDCARLGDRVSMAGNLNVLCLPPFGPVFRAFSQWTRPLAFEEALACFRIAAVLALAVTAWISRAPLVAIVAALSPEYLWGLRVGNITTIQAPLIWLCVEISARYPIRSGAICGALLALKPSLLPVGMLWGMLGWRPLLGLAGGFLAPTLISIAAIPGETLGGWWTGLAGWHTNPFASSPANVSLPGFLMRRGGATFGEPLSSGLRSLAEWFAAGILGLGAIAALVAMRRHGIKLSGAILCTAAVVAGPASWYHYPTVMICALAVAPPGWIGTSITALTLLAMNGDGHLIGTGIAPWPALALVGTMAIWCWRGLGKPA